MNEFISDNFRQLPQKVIGKQYKEQSHTTYTYSPVLAHHRIIYI